MTRPVILTGAALLAACTTTPAPEEAGRGSCSVENLARFHGRDATPELESEAMRLAGARAVRSIRPGAMVTMDFRQDRLNIDLDATGKVTGFRCG